MLLESWLSEKFIVELKSHVYDTSKCFRNKKISAVNSSGSGFWLSLMVSVPKISSKFAAVTDINLIVKVVIESETSVEFISVSEPPSNFLSLHSLTNISSIVSMSSRLYL